MTSLSIRLFPGEGDDISWVLEAKFNQLKQLSYSEQNNGGHWCFWSGLGFVDVTWLFWSRAIKLLPPNFAPWDHWTGMTQNRVKKTRTFLKNAKSWKKLKRFLNLTFSRFGQNEKNSKKSTWLLKLDKFENTLALLKKKCYFFWDLLHNYKIQKNSSYFAFSGGSEKWKA